MAMLTAPRHCDHTVRTFWISLDTGTGHQFTCHPKVTVTAD